MSRYVKLLLLLAIFFIPHSLTYASQSSQISDSSFFAGSAYGYQPLGTGLSGFPNSLQVMIELGSSGVFSRNYNWIVDECSDGNYTSCHQILDYTSQAYTTSTVATGIGTAPHLISMPNVATTTYSLQADKYYRIGWGSNSGAIRGSNATSSNLFSPTFPFKCITESVCTSNSPVGTNLKQSYYIFTTGSTTVNIPINATGTRIISQTPESGDILASTTNGTTIGYQYYVSSDDFCNYLCTTYAELSINTPLSTNKYTYNEAVPFQGTSTLQHYFSQINQQGTYPYEMRIYNRYLFGLVRSDLVWRITKFSVGRDNTATETQSYASTTAKYGFDTSVAIEAGAGDIGTQDAPSTITLVFRDVITQFLHLPPWGYVIVLNDNILHGTSSGVSSDIVVTFPTSSPAHGRTLTLPLRSGVTSAIASIRTYGTGTEFGDAYDSIIHYWNILWYLALALYMLKSLTGISFSKKDEIQDTPQQKQQRRKNTLTIPMNYHDGGFGGGKHTGNPRYSHTNDIDMRNT